MWVGVGFRVCVLDRLSVSVNVGLWDGVSLVDSEFSVDIEGLLECEGESELLMVGDSVAESSSVNVAVADGERDAVTVNVGVSLTSFDLVVVMEGLVVGVGVVVAEGLNDVDHDTDMVDVNVNDREFDRELVFDGVFDSVPLSDNDVSPDRVTVGLFERELLLLVLLEIEKVAVELEDNEVEVVSLRDGSDDNE